MPRRGSLPRTAVGVVVSLSNTLEPDVCCCEQPVETANHFSAGQVTLVRRGGLAGTKRRDRLEKPNEYAAAGVPHFWRIEQDPFTCSPMTSSTAGTSWTATPETELVLSAPFEIRLPIPDITP